MKIAVIKTGGKQYLVKAGSKLKIEKVAKEAGETLEVPVLLTAEDNGSALELGFPELAQKATLKVEKLAKAKKVMVVKYKSKTRYRRKVGHRQPYAAVAVESI